MLALDNEALIGATAVDAAEPLAPFSTPDGYVLPKASQAVLSDVPLSRAIRVGQNYTDRSTLGFIREDEALQRSQPVPGSLQAAGRRLLLGIQDGN